MTDPLFHADAAAASLLAETPASLSLHVRVGECSCAIRSNSNELMTLLRGYFAPFLDEQRVADLEIHALEAEPPSFPVEFRDWPRDPGKEGRKEEVADVRGGRIVRKVRTGMQFLLGREIRLAIGLCVENYNQIVNFLNAQHITWLLDREYVLCHAAGVVCGDGGMAIAAKSGGGKSTLAMHLMSRGARFTSNDRLLIRKTASSLEMAGVPKLPRINPGTVLNNRDLEPVIPSARRAELADLGEPELWALEEKYDVPIAEIFGADRFALSAPLDALLILNWSRNSQEPSRFRTVDLAERQDLLPAIMKPPGPFYMPADGTPPPAPLAVDPGSYLDLLRETKVVEAVGGVDFAAAARFCEDLVGGATELRG